MPNTRRARKTSARFRGATPDLIRRAPRGGCQRSTTGMDRGGQAYVCWLPHFFSGCGRTVVRQSDCAAALAKRAKAVLIRGMLRCGEDLPCLSTPDQKALCCWVTAHPLPAVLPIYCQLLPTGLLPVLARGHDRHSSCSGDACERPIA